MSESRGIRKLQPVSCCVQRSSARDGFYRSTLAINLMMGYANFEPQLSEMYPSPKRNSSLFSSRPVLQKKKKKLYSTITIIFRNSSQKKNVWKFIVLSVEDRTVGIIKLTLELLWGFNEMFVNDFIQCPAHSRYSNSLCTGVLNFL